MPKKKPPHDPDVRRYQTWPGLHIVGPKSRKRKPPGKKYVGIEFHYIRRSYSTATASRKRLLDPEIITRYPKPRAETITPRLRAELYWRRRDPCAYCGKPSEHWDHMDALARKGAHDADNMTRACRSCNSKKHTASALLFLAHSALARQRALARERTTG